MSQQQWYSFESNIQRTYAFGDAIQLIKKIDVDNLRPTHLPQHKTIKGRYLLNMVPKL